MIGFLILVLAVMGCFGLGYTLLMGDFLIFMNTTIILALGGLAGIILVGLLWEFYFPQPAKMFIASKRASAYELAVDDLGWGQLTPSKSYMPQGLVKWRFGWSLLPRPIMKLDIIQRLIGKKRGRPPKDPEKAQKAQEQFEARQQQLRDIERKEQELAEQIALKKCMLKGTGKPLWLQYIGLGANFNPYVLVPGELKQDNPHEYVSQMRTYVNGSASLTSEAKTDLLKLIQDLETHIDNVRVVIDPRRFKEIHPKMYTQSQIDDHGRIHEEIGRLSVSGLPLGKILIVLLVIVGVVGVIAAVYFLFMKPQQPQQSSALIRFVLSLL